MLTVRFVKDGVAVKLYKFHQPEVVVGQAPWSHVKLEPLDRVGAELRFRLEADGSYKVLPIRHGEQFMVNGEILSAAKDLRPNDSVVWGNMLLQVEGVDDDDEDQINPPIESINLDPELKPVAPPAEAQPPEKAQLSEEAQPLGKARQLERGLSPAEAQRAASVAVEIAPTEPAGRDNYLLLFFGPVRSYLEDDSVSEILINGPDSVYIERRGRLELTPVRFVSEQALLAAATNVARSVGRVLNADYPQLDARLPDGSRVHVVLPPLSRAGTVIAIRKFSKEHLTLEKMLAGGAITTDGAQLLMEIVKSRRNVLVAGATSSGKTSVLNVLSSFIEPSERILVIEDANELRLQQPHAVYFETRRPDEHNRGEITIRDLLRSALRLRPDRLVIGEIRGAEALDLLQALNTGHDGSMSTIHANGVVDSLLRLETCALLSGINLPLAALRQQVAAAIHVVVYTERLSSGQRRVAQISEILGLEKGEYRLHELWRQPRPGEKIML